MGHKKRERYSKEFRQQAALFLVAQTSVFLLFHSYLYNL